MEANSETTFSPKTNFFRAIEALGLTGNLNLTIRQLEDGNMVVSTILINDRVGDSARKKIIPLNITATPAELGEVYFKTITTPMKKSSELMTNMEAHLKSVEEAGKKSRMEQDKKKAEKAEKAKTSSAPAKVEDENAYKEAMEKSLQFEKEMKYDEAMEALPQEADFPKRKPEITKKRAELEQKAKLATSLFNQQ
ncbi:hypothetical protein ACS126_03650 [Sphingobacterium lactis]|uniref:prtrc system protein e n=1 Tax=Sphingobacterium TaxID=28453 RepID=UPI0021A4F405|nr:prtrc system protein e [Sphingobacterium hotanense]MCT1526058.1 prtrc system protein e [Sphingobacterium hotanense]